MMAKKITIELVDDISGASGATTTRFHLDGIDYEIDLADDRELRDRMAPWIAKSRKASGAGSDPKDPTTPHSNDSRRHDIHLIRVWARATDQHIPRRGRLPAALIAAYDQQHQKR
jgi:hypothetical protein